MRSDDRARAPCIAAPELDAILVVAPLPNGNTIVTVCTVCFAASGTIAGGSPTSNVGVGVDAVVAFTTITRVRVRDRNGACVGREAGLVLALVVGIRVVAGPAVLGVGVVALGAAEVWSVGVEVAAGVVAGMDVENGSSVDVPVENTDAVEHKNRDADGHDRQSADAEHRQQLSAGGPRLCGRRVFTAVQIILARLIFDLIVCHSIVSSKRSVRGRRSQLFRDQMPRSPRNAADDWSRVLCV